MKTKHTKGRWIMNVTSDAINNNPQHLVIESEDGIQICLASHHNIPIQEYVANAKLIVVAPEMIAEHVCNVSRLETVKEMLHVSNKHSIKEYIDMIIESSNNIIKKASE